MSNRPECSDGVLVAALDDGAVAYDLITQTVHHLNATAGTTLASCDGTVDAASIVADAVSRTGADAATVAADVDAVLATFTELGLVDRRDLLLVPVPRTGSPDAASPASGSDASGSDAPTVTRWLRVLDFTVGLRGAPEVVDRLDAHLGLPHADEPLVAPRGEADPGTDADPDAGGVGVGVGVSAVAPIVLDVVGRDDGFDVVADTSWSFHSVESLADQLGTIVNGYAAETHTCLTLHSGGVRTPDGRIVLLPAVSGDGKSTLTAALVAAGCDLLSDEIIGVDLTTGEAIGYPRRLSLEGASRGLFGLELVDVMVRDTDPRELRADVQRLAGRIGPIDAVVFPRFVDASADAPVGEGAGAAAGHARAGNAGAGEGVGNGDASTDESVGKGDVGTDESVGKGDVGTDESVDEGGLGTGGVSGDVCESGDAADVVEDGVTVGTATPVLERLDVVDGFNELLANTLNLLRVGQPGLDVLCHVAEHAATYRFERGDAHVAAKALLGTL